MEALQSTVVASERTKWVLMETDLVSACPSKRWSHTMCLSDPDTVILIGGEAADQNYCEDSLWKLELGRRSLLHHMFGLKE